MNIRRQRVVIDTFLKHHDIEVAEAKRKNLFDNAIRLVTGRTVVIDEPRSFCLRGLDAPDERLLLFPIKVRAICYPCGF